MEKEDAFIGLAGMGTALITPFGEDGNVDIPSYERLVADSIDAGINFLCVLGTTAETPTLTADEQRLIRDAAVRVNGGRRPILLGFGGNDTAGMIARMKQDTFEGIDALLIVTPFYNKPSQEGLYRHYRALSDASPLPIVLYNVPGRTGVNMTADTTLRIARDCHNVVAVKEASGKVEQIEQLLRERPEGFRVLSGDDKLTCRLMQIGADGAVSVASNLFPRELATLAALLRTGDYEAAGQLDGRLAPYYDLLFAEGSPTGVKTAMHLQGRCQNVLRLPLVPASDALTEAFRKQGVQLA